MLNNIEAMDMDELRDEVELWRDRAFHNRRQMRAISADRDRWREFSRLWEYRALSNLDRLRESEVAGEEVDDA